MVEGEDMQVVPMWARHGDAMQMGQLVVAVRPLQVRGIGEEIIELLATGHCRCAAVARHDDGATGIGISAAALDTFVAQPSKQKTGDKRVARTEYIEYFHAGAVEGGRVVDLLRDVAFYHAAALCAALHDQGGLGPLAYVAQRSHQVFAAAGNMELFLGADDQVELRQDIL